MNKTYVLNALEEGYRHIDTALLYGNQEIIGEAIRESGVDRSTLFVTTKVGFFPSDSLLPLPPLAARFFRAMGGVHPENMKTREKEAVGAGLKMMGVEYFDLCLIHSPLTDDLEMWGTWFPHEFTFRTTDGRVLVRPKSAVRIIVERLAAWIAWFGGSKGYEHRRQAWKNMEDLYREGKCRNIGVSNYEVPLLEEMESYASVFPAMNQLELHPLRQMRGVRKWCAEHGCAVTGYGTGILSEHPEISRIARKYKKTTAQVTLRWALESGIVVIPKTRTRSR